MKTLLHEELTGAIRQTAFEVHRYFGKGFAEKVYENALANRIRKLGNVARQQIEIEVHDEDGTVVGLFKPDIIVDDVILIEIKAIGSIGNEEIAQLLNYLKVTGFRLGLLINFGGRRLEFRRFVMGGDDRLEEELLPLSMNP